MTLSTWTPGHAFGGVHREADGGLGLVHVDDHAALDAARTLMADAEDAGAMGAAAQHVGGFGRDQLGDQADDLGGADVEHAENRALRDWKSASCGAGWRGSDHVCAPLPCVSRGLARRGGLFRQADVKLAGNAQVERNDVLLDHAGLLFEPRKRGDGVFRVELPAA